MSTLQLTRWMWTTDWKQEDTKTARIICFRKVLSMESMPAEMKIHISADTRYKLYVNGALREIGPSKGDNTVWFVDEIDLADSLRIGENVLAVAVLRYPFEEDKGNHSLFRTRTPGLFIDGVCADGWRCHVDRHTHLYREEARFAPLMIHENAAADPAAFGWKDAGFDDSAWYDAVPYAPEELAEVLRPERLAERTIPFMRRTPHRFPLPVKEIPAHSRERFVLDAGEEMCAFPCLAMTGGAGAEIEMLYAECYVTDQGKANRLDAQRGHLEGYRDTYSVLGAGTEERPESYEPYWFRTFRFIQITVCTADEPLSLHTFDYQETGYPLKVGTQAKASDESLSAIWDISLRTLRRCMHETYMDCPYYEQLQYAMDARSQILYTYVISADDRLARRTIDDFSRAQRPDGLLNCSYPNTNTNVIPGFSIYYILMVHDHMLYFGDKSLVLRYMPVIRNILHFFDTHRTEDGLVDQTGGVNGKAPFWSFIDWTKEWMSTEGMPAAGLHGPITMESLLYILGLQKAAELCQYIDLSQEAEAYRVRAEAVRSAVRRHCMDNRGMITDGPGSRELSQHTQVFGILTDTLTAEEGRRNLLKTVEDRSYTQCTVAMCYYLFRALEKTDLYANTDQYWELWREMIRNGCTTCVEAADYARSECHAWGALILYELPSVILGVRPAAPGYEKIRVAPVPGYLTAASGTVRTPKGDISVSWEKRGGQLAVDIQCSEELKERIIITR